MLLISGPVNSTVHIFGVDFVKLSDTFSPQFGMTIGILIKSFVSALDYAGGKISSSGIIMIPKVCITILNRSPEVPLVIIVVV